MPKPELRLISMRPSKPSGNSVGKFLVTSLFSIGSSVVSAIILMVSLAKLMVLCVLIIVELMGLYRPKDMDLDTFLWSGILK